MCILREHECKLGILERRSELEDDLQEVMSLETKREFTGIRIFSAVEILRTQ